MCVWVDRRIHVGYGVRVRMAVFVYECVSRSVCMVPTQVCASGGGGVVVVVVAVAVAVAVVVVVVVVVAVNHTMHDE